MRLIPFALLAIFCGWSVATFGDEPSTAVALAEIPAAVQKTIQDQTGDGKLGDIDKISDGGETAYDVELTAKNGQERDVTVNEDGTLSSVEVALAETPAPVQKSIKTLMSNGGLESINKNLDDSEITYDVALTKNGREKDFTIAADGTLLSAEVALFETPGAVQATIAAQLNGGKLENLDKNFDDDGISYDVETAGKDGREKNFTVAAGGGLLSVETTLAELPRPVRKTVKNQIGEGKILEIDKSFVARRGVLPYEVQGMKDGQPFDFSVGPRGRFLGMDD